MEEPSGMPLCQFTFAGASNQLLDETGSIACWDGSWNPCSSVAGLINSCTQSLIQALLRGGGSLAMSVVSVLVYRSCICCVV